MRPQVSRVRDASLVFPDSLSAVLVGQLCAAFFPESRMQFCGPPSPTGNPGSVYTGCETALALAYLSREHTLN
jgi:hypothetical protein